MGKKNIPHSKSEYYTNLMLFTVLEALVLLIFHLVIFNASTVISEQSINFYKFMREFFLPGVFFVSSALVVIFVCVAFAKNKRSSLLPAAKFFVYLALMTALMVYIPNMESLNTPGKYVVNFERGQKIASITSIIYVVASFAYYAVLSVLASKNAPKEKTKKIVHKKK